MIKFHIIYIINLVLSIVYTFIGPHFSGGICHYTTFAQFLKTAITLNDSPLSTMIKELYLAAFSIPSISGSPKITITVTRRLDGVGCDSPQFSRLWRDYPSVLRTLFKSFILKAAFDAMSLKFLHWDIRPANIIYQSSNGGSFWIIDWESGLNPFDSEQTLLSKSFSSQFTISKSFIDIPDFQTKCVSFVCEKIITSCLIPYVVMIVKNNVLLIC